MKARHYKYLYARFQTPDPVNGSISEPLSWNLYNYVQNNPLNYTDPEGKMAKLQGLGKAIDPYPLNYSFPLAAGWISPAELSLYYSIALSIALEVEYENYKIKYAEAVNEFISLLQEHINTKGEIYQILYNIFERAGFGILKKEVVTSILEINNKYIAWRTQEFAGTENKVESFYKLIRHPNMVALAHTHPNPPISAKPTYPEDYNAAAILNKPNIVVSRNEIWVVMPDMKEYMVLIGEWWNLK